MAKRLTLSPFYHNRPNFLRLCVSRDASFTYRYTRCEKPGPRDIVTPRNVSDEAKNKDLPVTPSELSSYDVAARCLLQHNQAIFYGQGPYFRQVPLVQTAPAPTDFTVGVELEVVLTDPELYSSLAHRLPPLSGNYRRLLEDDYILFDKVRKLAGLDHTLPSSDALHNAALLNILSKALQKRCPAGLLSNWFYFKSDSSLRARGVELVTIPLPSRIALNPKTWDGLCEYLNPIATSRNESCCGLHVHVNIGYFYPEWALTSGIDDDFFMTYERVVQLLSCCLYADLLHFMPTLLTQVFKRPPGTYCTSIPKRQLKPRFDEALYKDLFNFSSWAAVACARHKKKLPVVNKKGYPVRDSLSRFPSDIEDIIDGREVVSSLPRKDRKIIMRQPVIKSQSFAQLLPRLRQNIYRILAPSGRSANPFLTDLTAHHSILGFTSSTLEFRQGKGTLNSSEIKVIISFIYAFCTFIKRTILSGKLDNALVYNDETFVLDFLKFTSSHATDPSLRGIALSFLTASSDGSPVMIQYPQNTTEDHSYCCDTRGE